MQNNNNYATWSYSTNMTSSDEDGPKWPWVPQSHIDWSSQYGSESPALEVAGCDCHYTLLVLQARNDDDDDKHD